MLGVLHETDLGFGLGFRIVRVFVSVQPREMTQTPFTTRWPRAAFSPFLGVNHLATASILAVGLCGVAPAQAPLPAVESRGVSGQPTWISETHEEAGALAEVGPPSFGSGGLASEVSGSGVRTGVAEVSLPDAPGASLPGPQTTTPAAAGLPAPASNAPSKRVLFIIPNYRSVAAGSILPPQTVHQKFSTAVSDTVDPANFALSALVAGYDYGRGATKEFGSGGVAFGRYYWHALADQSIENLSVEFLVPALTHEDTRYYTLGRGTVAKRFEYSVSRIAITRSDSGKRTVNLGELLGAGLASGVSSRYYPASQRDASSVLSSYALNLGIDAASYVVREFDADLTRKFSREKH